MPAKAATPAHTYALIVGIERYADPDQRWDLNGPLNDALGIREWLLSRGVPADHIHLHVSALQANQEKLVALQTGYQDPTDQAIRKTIETLKKTSAAHDDLLIFYWAGHGLIRQADATTSTDQLCLLLSEATHADMKSYQVGNIRASFANENCPAFAQQLFLFDTCRSYHRHPEKPLPISQLPLGRACTKSQFLFFASQEGQSAQNLGQQQCGLFTRVLLDQLKSNHLPLGAWPPEMESIVHSVQAVFAEKKQQNPVFVHYRDWQGNETMDPIPGDVHSHPAGSAEAMDHPLEAIQRSDQPVLNNRLYAAILNGLGVADPVSVWKKLKKAIHRDRFVSLGDEVNGRDVLIGLIPGSLDQEIQQLIDLCSDVDNGFVLLRESFKTFPSSTCRSNAESCLQAYARSLPNQQVCSQW